jgi:deazaflavin-dependent oxidoreductase (nitroreductase family)
LIYEPHGDDYLVVASDGGGDPPGWFLNLQGDPIVAVRVKADHHDARARAVTAEEKPERWRIMTATGVSCDEFQAEADREIPMVVFERARPSGRSTTPLNARGPRESRVASKAGRSMAGEHPTCSSPRSRTPGIAKGSGRPVAPALTETRTTASTEAVTTAPPSALPL